MSLTVRAAEPDEWQALRAVRLAALLDAPDAYYSTYEQAAGRTEREWRTWLGVGGCFLAWLGGEPVGMVRVGPSAATGVGSAEPTGADLVAMWVAPATRGTGAADALMTAALDWARDHGYHHVDLEVAPGNVRAERVYARHGFVATGESTSYKCGLAMRRSFS